MIQENIKNPKNYQAMQEFMIYGVTLEFDELLSRLEELKKRFNERS